jgi:hypothetical protein
MQRKYIKPSMRAVNQLGGGVKKCFELLYIMSYHQLKHLPLGSVAHEVALVDTYT